MIPFQPGANIYTQGFGSRPENVEVPHIDIRAPNSSDILYPIGKQWVDTVAKEIFFLAGLSSINGVTIASWEQVSSGSGGGPIDSLTGNTGVATEVGGNINVFGVANQITTTGSLGELLVGLTNGVSLGSYQAATPPVGGMLIPGQVGIGTKSTIANSSLEIFATPANAYQINLTGTIAGTDGSANQFGLASNSNLQPSTSAGQIAGIQIANTFTTHSPNTTTQAFGLIVQTAITGNTGTITNAGNIFTGTGSISGVAATNGYGGYFSSPRLGVTGNTALYADDLSVGVVANGTPTVGTVRTAPPASVTATNTLGPVTFNTPKQNTLGYDVIFTGTVEISAATAGILSMAVGSGATPSGSPLTPAITTSSTILINFSAYVPMNYYFSLATASGSLTVASITTIMTPV